MSEKTSSCNTAEGTHTAPDNSDVANRMEKIDHKIVVMSGKGGVGKSTVAANLAIALSMDGAKVGLLDVDIHGPNIPKMLGIEGERLVVEDDGIVPITVPPGVKVMSMAFLLADEDTPVIWRGPMKMGVIRQFLGEVNWGELDYLIIDLPPGTGDEPMSIAQLISEGAGAVIVTTPQDVALLDSRKSVSFARAINLQVIGVVENMSGFTCPHCGSQINLFKFGGGEKAAKELDIPFLGRIPMDPSIVEMGDSGTAFIMKDPDSDPAKAFYDIVKNIEDFTNSSSERRRR